MQPVILLGQALAVVALPSVVSAPAGVPAQPAADRVIPALTAVALRFDEEVSSQSSKTGATFPLTLAEPIILDCKVVVPAGARGEGEVIWAKKSGGAGTAGELVLAARWIEVGGRHLRLRSMQPGAAGRDSVGKVDAYNAATVISPLPIGLLGFAMKGATIVRAKGSLAVAKTVEAFPLGDANIPTGSVRNDELCNEGKLNGK